MAGVLGWVATHFVGKPFLTYRALREDIARCLILYANIPCPPQPTAVLPARTVEAQDKYRGFASELMAVANTIACYQLWSFLGIMPKWKDLDQVRGNLIGLSNSIGEPNQGPDITRRETNIRRLLRIR